MKKVLLLTGCVNPDGMVFTALNDAEIRKKQYINAINWYLNNTELDVVFVENTNTNLSKFLDVNGNRKRLEVLTFEGNNYDKSLGKGYGEANIIEYALNKSEKIKNADLIAKVTGRLIVTNVNELIKQCNNIHCLYIKELYINRRCFASQFFVTSQVIYNLIVENKFKLNDSVGYYFEHLLYDVSHEIAEKDYSIKEFFPPIKLSGVSGSSGIKYHFSFVSWIKNYVKYFIHRLGFHFC